jgi:glycerophosphoryl diester phosphodiesterase
MPVRASHNRPLLLGHRGSRAVRYIPENTIQSFERALADGCDGFEFDVRLTADGEAVVCHDPRVGGIKIAQASGAQLPELSRLEEVLARVQARAFLDIELKVGGLERITLELLRRHPPKCGYVVSSFLEGVLRTLHSQDSTVPVGLICETVEEFDVWRNVPGEYVIPHHGLLNAGRSTELKSAGKKIIAWTVNDRKEMLRCQDLGVEGIISDDAALLSRTFSGG